MGSGDWLKNIVSLNKARKQRLKKMKGTSLPETNGFVLEPREGLTNKVNRVSNEAVGLPVDDMAATRIQTAIRAFMARKALRNLKGVVRLQTLTKGDYGMKQTSNTLNHLRSWGRIQTRIRTRRLCMVEEGGMRQKKLENQLKLEAKLRNLQVEWSGGAHTMDETLARIQQREEASIKRERAMAYAFSHQWRAKSKSNLSPNASELANANWGWSWMERWIVTRPWESRVAAVSTPKKVNTSVVKPGKKSKSPTTKKSNSPRISPNAKKPTRNRKLSYGSIAKVED